MSTDEEVKVLKSTKKNMRTRSSQLKGDITEADGDERCGNDGNPEDLKKPETL
jgi:hypothetical protein